MQSKPYMRLYSLKNKLLVAVSALVIGSGLLISLLFTQRYSSSVYESMAAQAENLAHAIALDVTDKILTNDLIALQKMLDYQIRSNDTIAYLFVTRENQILAHTFTNGFPLELIEANFIDKNMMFNIKMIESTEGENYYDVAWSIFDAKAGVLRLGLFVKPYRSQVIHLLVKMSSLIFGILLIAICVSLWFVRKVTRPLTELSLMIRGIAKAEVQLDSKQEETKGEIDLLTISFKKMISRIKDYTQRLEDKNIELNRAYRQTRCFCEIIQQIGSQHRLNEIGSMLIAKFEDILKCKAIGLLFFSDLREAIYCFTADGFKTIKDPENIQSLEDLLKDQKRALTDNTKLLKPPLVPGNSQFFSKQAIVAFHNEKNQVQGVLVAGCQEKCRCNPAELEVAKLILTQSAGVIRRAIYHEEEIRSLRDRIEITAGYNGIIGKDPQMQSIYKLIEDIAPTDATVLIEGESGTGKELVAQAIHQKSNRRNEPFMVINCSAFPDTLLESELFGHEKGAFTGAIRQKTGRFELANGGTVFLDEIGEIPLSAQTKLLRVLQTKKFERLGGENTLKMDVRILAATNKNLNEEVKAGHFREDLFYRLNVIPIQLPPLRNRGNDIPLLADHFRQIFSKENCKKSLEFSSEAMRLLLNYSWPGNVRELENSIEHAVLLAKNSKIEVSDLPAVISRTATTNQGSRIPTLAENEKEFLKHVLQKCGWNKRRAAQNLAISRNTLYLKLKKYQISAQSFNN